MRPIIAGNWKMNKTIDESISFINSVKETASDGHRSKIIFCPPFTSLFSISKLLNNSDLLLGAQNVHSQKKGAFTGEISVDMLKSALVQYVIIGHSERRKLFGESNKFIQEKVFSVINSGLIPIFCIGEELDERSSGETELILKKQLESVFNSNNIVDIKKIIIAYEPIWAIGTGDTATTNQVEEAHSFIRLILENIFGNNGQNIPIIYGGSVDVDNAKSLINVNSVDGFLIGGASLDSKSFCKIIKIVSENYNRG